MATAVGLFNPAGHRAAFCACCTVGGSRDTEPRSRAGPGRLSAGYCAQLGGGDAMLSRAIVGFALGVALAEGAAAQSVDSALERAIREAASKWQAKYDKLEQHLRKKHAAVGQAAARGQEPLKLGDLHWVDEKEVAIRQSRQTRSWLQRMGLPDVRLPWSTRG